MHYLIAMPGLVPGIHVLGIAQQVVHGRDKRAYTPVFDGLCPAMMAQDAALSTDNWTTSI